MQKKYTLTLLLFVTLAASLIAQTRIDNQISFQNDPAKQYSVFVPSSYDETVPNKLMVALHPFNTNRWNSISWCDTLIAFAETNNLILICPDGGIDGKVDDPIDTAFTTFIIDSTLLWYNIDASKIFAMGFSWGARTTYTYGLNHVNRFAGFLPIGAAINGLNEVSTAVENGTDKPFFIIHGSNDNPSARFFPIRDALIDNTACVNTNFLPGVGHTIDFANRNAILTEAFQWLDTVSCNVVSPTFDLASIELENAISIAPNPIPQGSSFDVNVDNQFGVIESIEIWSITGELMQQTTTTNQIKTDDLAAGVYLVKVLIEQQVAIKRVLVQ